MWNMTDFTVKSSSLKKQAANVCKYIQNADKASPQRTGYDNHNNQWINTLSKTKVYL